MHRNALLLYCIKRDSSVELDNQRPIWLKTKTICNTNEVGGPDNKILHVNDAMLLGPLWFIHDALQARTQQYWGQINRGETDQISTDISGVQDKRKNDRERRRGFDGDIPISIEKAPGRQPHEKQV